MREARSGVETARRRPCVPRRATARMGEWRQSGALALVQLARRERREVVPAQRGVRTVQRVPGLDPHLAARGVACVAPARLPPASGRTGAPAREVAREQRAVGVDGSHQRDAAKVVALRDHLRADGMSHLAGVHRPELRLQRAPARVVSASMRATRAPGQLGDLLLRRSVPRPIGAMSRLPQSGAGARHRPGQARSGGNATTSRACGRRARRCSAGRRSSIHTRRSAVLAHSRAG